jgi:hypothetical protein
MIPNKYKLERRRLTDNELSDYPITGLVDGWFFRINEVSFGAYEVKGTDRWGRIVSSMGIETDITRLLQECVYQTKKINQEIKHSKINT